MIKIDAAIDDYLHTIIRTRPWTKKREEEVLEAFGEWVYEQPGVDVALASIDPQLMEQYVAAQRLSGAEQDELQGALNNVCLWATHQGWIETNPFALDDVASA